MMMKTTNNAKKKTNAANHTTTRKSAAKGNKGRSKEGSDRRETANQTTNLPEPLRKRLVENFANGKTDEKSRSEARLAVEDVHL